MGNKKNRITVFLIILTVIFSAFAFWVLWGNTAVELNEYTVQSKGIPQKIDGYRIAHISDFHNTEIGEDNEKLISIIKEAEPDIIAITGDIVDWRRTDIEIAKDFVSEVLKIAPCYYVSGNNESYITDTYDVKKILSDIGVVVLEDESQYIEIEGEKILLAGVDDPAFSDNYSSVDSGVIMQTKLEELMNDDIYTVLLSHRPELFGVYCEYEADLVLSGHAHGGQFRIPFVGGVYAPDQGLFPEYDAGLYTDGKTNMIVSRGIGNSKIPIRFNNRPEVIVIELEVDK